MRAALPASTLSCMQMLPSGPLRIYEFSMLKSMRIREGLSQGELAQAVGASAATVSRLERGKSCPSVGLALALAQRLHATVEELFSADDLR